MVRALSRLLAQLDRPAFFGMIHVPALPGTPRSSLAPREIIQVVRHEAAILADAGVDGIIVENMHDIPYVQSSRIGPEIVSSMSLCCAAVREVAEKSERPSRPLLGVQILAGANRKAVAVAHATGFDFVRAECFVFSHVADEGWMDGCAGELLRFRRQIGADSVAVITDVKKKHSSHSVTADVTLAETARAAEFFLADGVILTGAATGSQAEPAELEELKRATTLPVLIGSGIDTKNAALYSQADAFIVGSSLKANGDWRGELDEERVKELVRVVGQEKNRMILHV